MCAIFSFERISSMNQQKFEQWPHNSMRLNGSTQTNWIWFWYLVCGLCWPRWPYSARLIQFEWPTKCCVMNETRLIVTRTFLGMTCKCINELDDAIAMDWTYSEKLLRPLCIWALCHFGHPQRKKTDFVKLFIVSVINQWHFSLTRYIYLSVHFLQLSGIVVWCRANNNWICILFCFVV